MKCALLIHAFYSFIHSFSIRQSVLNNFRSLAGQSFGDVTAEASVSEDNSTWYPKRLKVIIDFCCCLLLRNECNYEKICKANIEEGNLENRSYMQVKP